MNILLLIGGGVLLLVLLIIGVVVAISMFLNAKVELGFSSERTDSRAE